MRMYYCNVCEKFTGHKRAYGFGTFFLVLITFGWGLLLLPFYPLRCIVCGSQKGFKPRKKRRWFDG